MAEPGSRRSAVAPSPVQIVSTEDVAALVEHCDATIARLEDELAHVEDDAARAEARLRAHPAAAVMGDEFERSVRGGVERHLEPAVVERERVREPAANEVANGAAPPPR